MKTVSVFLIFIGILAVKGEAQFITDHDPHFMPVVAKPAAGTSFEDPVFGTSVKRLTDALVSGMLGTVPQYSKRQVWNANDSLMLLLNADDGFFSLYDGSTHAFIRDLDDPAVGGDDVFWHPLNKNIIIYCADSIIYSYDVGTNQRTEIQAFPDYTWVNSRGEGNLSHDGRYYAFIGQDYDAVAQEVIFRDIIVYDLVADEEVSRMVIPNGPTDGTIDWISISPLGNFVIVDYSDYETGRYHGIEVYDRQMRFLWQQPLGAGHTDIGVDVNGDEIFIMDVYDDGPNVTHINKYRFPDGTMTHLLDVSPFFDVHLSLRSTNRQGWGFISTFDNPGRLTDDSLTWLPFEDEIFALKLDGSQQVQRIAHHHSRRFSPITPDPDQSIYWAEPHATVNRNGTKVIWGSNWRQDMNLVTSCDTYFCDFSNFVGINNQASTEKPKLQLFPNPAHGEFTIQLEKSGYYQICLLDLSGHVMKRQWFNGSRQSIRLDTFPPGTYILEANGLGEQYTSILVIN